MSKSTLPGPGSVSLGPSAAPRRWRSAPKVALALSAACFAGVQLCRVHTASANGTADYFDVNGTTAGFGSPTSGTSPNAYDANGSYWDTSSAGTGTPAAWTNNDQLTIGASASDFSGLNFEINLDQASNDVTGIIINSTSVTVTILGTNNMHSNGATTWSVAAGSTLIMADTGNNNGFNFNKQTTLLTGGGTMNFTDAFAANDGGGSTITEDMTGSGIVILNQTITSNFGSGETSGGFTLQAGALQFASAGSLTTTFANMASGTSVTIDGGTIDNVSGSNSALNLGSATYNIGGSFTYVGSTGSMDMGTASVALTATPTVTVSNNTLQFDGNIGGGQGLIKAGAGTLSLTGNNTYTGGTTINAGTLLVTGSLASAGNVTINSSATLKGISSAIGNVTMASGGTLSPGTTNTPVGTLNLTSLTVSGGTLVYNLGASDTSDLLNVSGNASFTGGSTIDIVSPVQGSFLLLTASSLSGTKPALSGIGAYNATEVFSTSGNYISLILSLGPVSLTWDGDGGASWDTTTPSWNELGNPASTYADGANVIFDDTNTNSTLIALNSTVMPGSVTVNSSNNNYTFYGAGSIAGTAALVKSGQSMLIIGTNNTYTGGTTINPGGSIQVGFGGNTGTLGSGSITNNGSLSFDRDDAGLVVASNITGTGMVTQGGVGTTTLTGNNSYTGGTTVAAGTLVIGAAGALPSGGNVINNAAFEVSANSSAGNVSGNGNTTVSPGVSFSAVNFSQADGLVNNGTTTLTGSGTVGPVSGTGSLTINGGTLTLSQSSGLSTMNSLALLNNGTLDVDNNHVYINYGSNADPVATIRGYLVSGYNGGNWNGPGLMSTAAYQADVLGADGARTYALGYADGVDGVVSGLSSGTIEVMYTLVGDLDLNGRVNGNDFLALENNFGQPVAAWDAGDLDYNGHVNGNDFLDLENNFGFGDSGAAIQLSAADWAAFDAFAEGNNFSTAVPEPASLGLLALGGIGLLARRRRTS